jgi:hypothetical protein
MLSSARPPVAETRRDTPGEHRPLDFLNPAPDGCHRVARDRMARVTCGDAGAPSADHVGRDTPGVRRLKGRNRFGSPAGVTPPATGDIEPRREPEPA